MRAIVGTHMKGKKLSPTPKDLELCSRVFKKAGGSWERVFKGSVHDIVLLKTTLKVAAKKGHITKTPKWG